jgi:miniconductance mechanosensitive channel
MTWFTNILTAYQQWLTTLGLNTQGAILAYEISLFLVSLVVFLFVDKITTHLIRNYIKKLIAKSTTQVDDILYNNKVFAYFLHIFFAYLWYLYLDFVFVEYKGFENFVKVLIELWMTYLLVRGIIAILHSFNDLYDMRHPDRTRTIKSYIQVFQLIAIIVGSLIAISIVVNKDISVLLTGIGAFTAVLLLVFRDTILGFVGGMQINANEMLSIGDWITVPSANADGIVIDITLTTVKIQNGDKSISSIPTYSLVSNSFQNWKGMEQSGGRRIKRSIIIDIHTVKFCSPDCLVEMAKIPMMNSYVQNIESEIQEYNQHADWAINSRKQQTNIGLFRAYILHYLQAYDSINNDMIIIVRQLQATESGLPIEIIAFSKIKAWVLYEDVQSDIFDHLIAMVPVFQLQIFQNPSGLDLKSIGLRH